MPPSSASSQRTGREKAVFEWFQRMDLSKRTAPINPGSASLSTSRACSPNLAHHGGDVAPAVDLADLQVVHRNTLAAGEALGGFGRLARGSHKSDRQAGL